jgi:hypothetical protein
VAVCQVQTEKSKRRLTPEEVVAAIRTNADFEDDLKALFTLGITASEKEAAEASVKAKKDAAVAESAAKAEQQKVETERLLAENAALKAASAAIASSAAPAAAPAPAAANPVAAPAANPAAAPTAAAPAANPAAPLLATILALLDEVEASVQGLSEQEQVTVTARLAEMAEMFATA